MRQAEVAVPAAAAVGVVAVTGVVTALEAAALSFASHSSLKKLRPLVTG
jgi:hypothetical protein